MHAFIPKFSCFINEKSSKCFKVGRGFKQDNPLSPYLYIIVAKLLSYLLTKVVENDKFIPFNFKNKYRVSSMIYFSL